MKNIKLFQNIAGYDDIKEELMTIYSWFQDKEILNNNKIQLPTGILFYGHPGNGKTLFIREYANALKAPNFIIKDTNDIKPAFDKARQEKFALVLIDEIDLLIDKNSETLRILQGELDGLDRRGKILVLATTNHQNNLPNALIRPGRFDRQICIADPDIDDIKKIYTFYLKELGINTAKFDLTNIVDLSNHCSCATIKTICNEAFLRGKKNLNEKHLQKAYECIVMNEFANNNPLKYKNYRIAVHEAGHAIMSLRFQKDIKLYNAKFTRDGGYTQTYEVDNLNDNLEKRLERIQISLSGAIAEKIFFKRHDIGSTQDIKIAHDLIFRLIERTGYTDFNCFTSINSSMNRSDTVFHQFKNEIIANRIMKKQRKLVYKYLNHNKKIVKDFADLLFAKGEITNDDINKLFYNEVDTTPINPYLLPKAIPAWTNKKND